MASLLAITLCKTASAVTLPAILIPTVAVDGSRLIARTDSPGRYVLMLVAPGP